MMSCGRSKRKLLKLTRMNSFLLYILGPGKDSNPKQNNAPINGQQQFGRPKEENFKVVFPRSTFLPENSKHIRFPTERHSVHGINVEPSAAPSNRIRSIVVFPRSDTKNENELPTVDVENVKTDPIIPIATQSNETNEPFRPNSVDASVFVVNQTAIENGFVPMIYIDDDGVFQVKYVAKGENVSASNDKQPHSNGPSLVSMEKAEETAIISNDNRQIPQDHRSPNNGSSTTIDLIDSNATVNNIVMNRTHIKDPSSGEQQQKQQPKPSSGNKHPRDFNGQLIFV